MESGFDPLKVKVRENPAWVALRGEVPSLTIPFQLGSPDSIPNGHRPGGPLYFIKSYFP
jgi:hypothetical protein